MFDEITGGAERIVVGRRELHARAYVASFGFKGSDQQKKVGQLSGGERNRVQLAKVLHSGGNVLLLDEPTNDLDVDTLRALEEALLEFPGCAVVISHDRWFLDRIATHVLAFEGDSDGALVGGELQRLRGGPQAAAGGRGRPAAPLAVQAAGARLTHRLAGCGRARKERPSGRVRAQSGRVAVGLRHSDPVGPVGLRSPAPGAGGGAQITRTFCASSPLRPGATSNSTC